MTRLMNSRCSKRMCLMMMMKKRKRKYGIRIKDQVTMKDDIIEIVELMKDRVVDLNIKTRQLLGAAANVEEDALYRNYVQVVDYIVQSMKNELNVVREWEIMFRILRDADRDKGRRDANRSR
eukprot:943789_1